MANSDSKPKVKMNTLPENPEKKDPLKIVKPGRFPSWLHRKMPKGKNFQQTGKVLSQKRLHTVCEEAKCPNLFECWSNKTATFLIMGKECTRACGFCDIDFSKNPKALADDEPKRVAESVKLLNLKHVVITMVARDDISDQGASHIVKVIQAIKKENPCSTIEVLTSDFNGNTDALKTVLDGGPDIFNHNIETVRSLTARVRHKASYDRTLHMLKFASNHLKMKGKLIKSGLMVGLGETKDEVEKTLNDLLDVGTDIVTIGQYLQPNRKKLLVKEFISPSQFEEYASYGLKIGLAYVYSGPFVRSSYNAGLVLEKAGQKKIIGNR